MSVEPEISRLKQAMEREKIVPERGLGEELFLFASTLMPTVNVDLLVTNDRRQILLSWRDDPHCGTGWHVPGGCIRLKETCETRIRKTAMAELGTEVLFQPEPVGVYEIFFENRRPGLIDQNERVHTVTLAYACHLPKGVSIAPERMREGATGCLRWFDGLPENLLDIQSCYREHWSELSKKIWRN